MRVEIVHGRSTLEVAMKCSWAAAVFRTPQGVVAIDTVSNADQWANGSDNPGKRLVLPKETRPRLRERCGRGHEYTPENTGQNNRGRFCRQCKRIKEREYHRRNQDTRNEAARIRYKKKRVRAKVFQL